MTPDQATEIITVLNVIMWMLVPITASSMCLIIIGMIKVWNAPDKG